MRDPFIISGVTGEVQDQASDSLTLAADLDPAKEAHLKELSAKSGLDVGMLRNVEPRFLKSVESNPQAFVATPAMKKYFADLNRAAISYDDAGNLAKGEEAFSKFRRDRDVVFQTPRAERERQAVVDLFPEIAEQTEVGPKLGRLGVQAGSHGADILGKTWRGEEVSFADEELAKYLKSQMEETAKKKEGASFIPRTIGETGYLASMMTGLGIMTLPKAIPAAVGATVGMIVGTGANPAGMTPQALMGFAAAGTAAGFSSSSALALYNLEAGNAFLELRDEVDELGNKLDPKLAAITAHTVGLINTGLERAGMKMLSRLPVIGKYIGAMTGEEISRGAKMALRDPIFRERAKEIIKNFGTAALGESGTEMLQELPQMILGYAVKAHENEKGGKAFKLPENVVGFDENSVVNLSQLGEVGYSTLLGTMGLGGLPTIHALYQVGKEAETAQKLGESFDAVRKTLQENETSMRSPTAIKEFVDLLSEGTTEEAKTLYVDGREALELFQTDRKAFDVLGITEFQINEAAAAGDALEVKTADVLGRMVGAEFNQTFASFSQILKMAPAAMSRKEADRLSTPEAAAKAVELFNKSQEFLDVGETLKEIHKQIVAAKNSPEEAADYISLLDRLAYGLMNAGQTADNVKQFLKDFRVERHVVTKGGTMKVDFTPAPFMTEVGPAVEEAAAVQGEITRETLKKSVEQSPLLSAVKKAGGVITSKKKAKTTGGEYDDARGISEDRKKLIRGKQKVDELARDLHRQGLLPDDSPATFWKAVQGELEGITKSRESTEALKARQTMFEDWRVNRSETVEVMGLRPGDEYKIQGKTYRVAEETDQALRVTSEDGYDAMFPFEENTAIRIDKGTLVRSGAPVELNQIQRQFADRIAAKIAEDTTKVEKSETISPTDEVVGPGKEYFQIHGLEQWRRDVRNWMKRQTEFDGKTKRFTDEEIEAHLAGIEAQFKIFEALGPMQIEKFPHTIGKASKKWGPFRKNQEEIYKISFDASAMCVKRIEMAATMAYIEEQLAARTGGARNALTAAERTALACLFKLAGKSAPCLYCYVEGPRGKEGTFIEQGMEALFRDGEPGPDWSQTTRRRLAEALEYIRRNNIKATDIDIGSLLDPLRRDTEEVKAMHGDSPVYKFLRTLRGAAKAKKAQTYAEYQSNVLGIPQDLLDELNGYAGLRFFSSSDFQAEHVVDLMQAFVDMEVRKAKAHSYTKVPMFAEIFGATGMKINCSIFGKWVNGKPVMDTWQGMDWNEAQRLRKEYPNVGTVLVATSPEMIEWGLNTDWVDYIIPYHYAAGFESKYFEAMDWQNFSAFQKEMWRLTEAEKLEEKKAKQAAKMAGRKWENPRGKFPPQIRMWQLGLDRGRGDMSLAEYNRQASRRYLDLCEEKGYEPVFERVLLSNGESVTTHPNYIKLKKDYARTDTAFDPVKADFSGKKQQAAIEKALSMVLKGDVPKATPDKKIAAELLRMIKNAKPGEDIGVKMLRQLGLNKEFNQTRNIGFYSALEKFVMNSDFKQIPASDLLKRIEKAPLKKEELDDIGLQDWLRAMGNNKVSKEQVTQFIQDRGPQLFETTRDTNPPVLAWSDPIAIAPEDPFGDIVWRANAGPRMFTITKIGSNGKFRLESPGGTREIFGTLERAQAEAQRVSKNYPSQDAAKFETWTLKGGTNYREVLLRIPERKLREFSPTVALDQFKSEMIEKYGGPWESAVLELQADEVEQWYELRRSALTNVPIPGEDPNFVNASHFPELNIIAHLRLKDFVGADGKKVLHIEEIQSDWAQGRREALKARAKLQEEIVKIKGVLPGLEDMDLTQVRIPDSAKKQIMDAGMWDDYAEAQRKVKAHPMVPDAPFKKSWETLAFKRVLRLAAEGGYDRVTWTTGEQQTVRYNEDLKIRNAGMVAAYDERLVNIANGIGKKYETKTGKTVIGKEGTTLEGQDIVYTEPHTVHSLDLPAEMKEDILAGQTLYQPGKKVVMGSTRITDTSYLVRLFEGVADESTLIHELGHVFLLEYQSLVASGKATPEFMKDWNTITEWLGLKPGEAFDTPHHEKFAVGFEAYLREGKAPSIELEGAFERFKTWLRKVYTTVQDLWARAGQEVRLTPAIRRVFDRMLATDLEVEAAATRNGLLIPESDLDRLGVKPADKAFIKQLLDRAREKGKAKYDKIRARREAERNAPWVEEATKKLEAERAFRTIARIRAEGLNTALVEEIVGPGATEFMTQFRKRIPAGLRKEGGLDPNQLAAEMGYDSGSDMIGEVYTFPTKDEYIKSYVEQKKAEAGEEAPTAEETLLEGAEAEEIIATIGRQILKKVNPTKMVRSQDAHIDSRLVRSTAEKKINEMPLKDAIRVDKFLAAFRTASTKTRDAMGKDEWQRALEFNAQARLQLELLKLSREIRDRLEDQVSRVKKALRSTSIDLDYQYQLINTAFRFGLSPRQLPHDNTRRSLGSLLAPDEDAGIEMPPVFPNEILDPENSRSYKELNTAIAMELFDLLKYLEVTGRRLVSGEQLTRKETIEQTVTTLISDMPSTKATVLPKNSFLRKLSDWSGDYLASCKVLQFIFRAADGLSKLGAHTTMLWNEIQRGYNEKINRRDAVLEMIKPSLDYFAERKQSWDASKITIPVPDLMKKDGRSWAWEHVLGVALNRGNAYNLNAVMVGYGLSRSDIDTLTASVENEDWNHIQKIWDAIDSLWPDLKKTYEDVSIVAPKKVSADPFAVTTSDGVYRLIRGGYFPVSFDSQLALRVEEWNEKDNLLNAFGAAFPKPSVPNGMLQSRVGTGGLPVQLDYRFVLLKHIDFATTYIGLARVLKDVDAITRNKIYVSAFVDRFGVATYKQIRPVLAYIARGSLRSFDSVEKGIRAISQMGTAAAMFGRASTVMKQFFDRGTLASEVGEINFQRGNLTMLQNPVLGLRFIEDASPMMRERFRQKYAGLNETVMQTFAESTIGEKGVIGAQETFAMPFRLFDMVNTSAAWMGAYQAHLSETLDHDAAVHFADNAISAAAPSSRPMDISGFQRDGSAFKMLFAPFNSWRIKFQNRLVSTTKGILDGQVSLSDAVRMAFLELFYPAVGWFLVRSMIQGDEPEKKDVNDLALDGVRMIFGAFPIAGDVFQGVAQAIGGFQSRGSFQPPAIKAGEDIVQSAVDMIAPTKEGEEPLAIKRRLWGLAGAASVVLRIPATRLYVDLLEGMRQYEETGRPGLILLPDSELRRR